MNSVASFSEIELGRKSLRMELFVVQISRLAAITARELGRDRAHHPQVELRAHWPVVVYRYSVNRYAVHINAVHINAVHTVLDTGMLYSHVVQLCCAVMLCSYAVHLCCTQLRSTQ